MTPAEYVRALIEPLCDAQGYVVYVGHMPDSPDAAVCVYDTRGARMETRRSRTGEVEEHPRVEILVRAPANSGTAAAVMLDDIWAEFRPLYMKRLSDGTIMRQITKTNTIVSLGQEPQKRRWLYSQRFRMTLEQ